MKRLFIQYFEMTFWFIALLLLAFLPEAGNFSLCPLQALGFNYCPGCGLGRSIHLAFAGSFSESFKMHPMGIPAILIITNRIILLIKINFKFHHDQSNQPSNSAISV